ncbi:DUF6265 family protein [Flavobacterium sp. H122]|uniref:DUF6265 family protein n=1 Tax=Flavobacterium sp. H122 TaxID=2529860 RepID=UPI0010AAD6D3|nr:DUF6265 family protein [Flavobacterium sp. H122]
MKKLITLLSLSIVYACMHKQEKKEYPLIAKANWFLGEWHNISEYGDLTEKWEKLTDSTITGECHIIKGKDTVFQENVLLEQRNDSLFYNVIVKDKDKKEEESTSFYLTQSSAKQLVFENPKHDFPTKIVYNLITSDSISASIHGKEKGIEKSETFPMSKKK